MRFGRDASGGQKFYGSANFYCNLWSQVGATHKKHLINYELNFDEEHYVFLKQYSAKTPKDVIEEMLKTDCRYGRISKLYAFDKAGEQHEIEEIEMLKKLLRAFPVDTKLF
ncbi:hypothetical protein L596_009312 [Steinernema carpocapsae]|uniref:Uncharacterized protein n=1 Tax=Steinernema carpocapsae TaxID=34508 RepID=A0A4U5PEZ6_STECR|nr:hypothetical protein L596_009312 [Steinernema carpocapsae]